VVVTTALIWYQLEGGLAGGGAEPGGVDWSFVVRPSLTFTGLCVY
jgi:hypothetical protein